VALPAGCGPSGSSVERADTVPDRMLPVLDSGSTPLAFQDQADGSFRRFRTDLLAAMARHDTAFLFGVLDPGIRTSFGDDGGIREFRQQWRLGEPDTPLWRTLTRILELGGRLDGDSLFSAPYVYALWPDSIDAFTHVAVTTPGALVRPDSSATLPPLGTLRSAIVELVEFVGGRDPPTANDTVWAHILLPGARHGWMRAEDVYSPVGWRAIFTKRERSWRLTALVAGD
jgi:hypothetical protein